MRDHNDVRANKMTRSEFGRRGVDMMLAEVQVIHGIVYLRGIVQRTKSGEYDDLKVEVAHIARLLRQKPEVRDVVVDVTYRE
jgi:hypothetical protein